METFIDDGYRRIGNPRKEEEVLEANKAGRIGK
jgi:hypothetical protein